MSGGCLVRQGPQLLQAPILPTYAVSCEDSAVLKTHRTVHGCRVEAPGTHPGLAFSSHVPRDPWLPPISRDKCQHLGMWTPNVSRWKICGPFGPFSGAWHTVCPHHFSHAFWSPRSVGHEGQVRGMLPAEKTEALWDLLGSPSFFTRLSLRARPNPGTCASETACPCLFHSLQYQGVCALRTYMWAVQSPTPNPGPWSSMPPEKQVNRTRVFTDCCQPQRARAQ